MIDFGLMRLGETPSTELFIRNTTQLNATWALRIEDQERFGVLVFITLAVLYYVEVCNELAGPFPRHCVREENNSS